VQVITTLCLCALIVGWCLGFLSYEPIRNHVTKIVREALAEVREETEDTNGE
jgi:hypothetical protein